MTRTPRTPRAAARLAHAADAVGSAMLAEAVAGAVHADPAYAYGPVDSIAEDVARRAHGAALRAIAAAAPSAQGRAATRAWGFARTAQGWALRAMQLADACGGLEWALRAGRAAR